MSSFTPQSKAMRTFPAGQVQEVRKTAPEVTTVLSHDAIARRAYDIYVRKGRQQGQCKENWYQAEQDLRRRGLTGGAAQSHGAAVAGSHPTGSR